MWVVETTGECDVIRRPRSEYSEGTVEMMRKKNRSGLGSQSSRSSSAASKKSGSDVSVKESENDKKETEAEVADTLLEELKAKRKLKTEKRNHELIQDYLQAQLTVNRVRKRNILLQDHIRKILIRKEKFAIATEIRHGLRKPIPTAKNKTKCCRGPRESGKEKKQGRNKKSHGRKHKNLGQVHFKKTTKESGESKIRTKKKTINRLKTLYGLQPKVLTGGIQLKDSKMEIHEIKSNDQGLQNREQVNELSLSKHLRVKNIEQEGISSGNKLTTISKISVLPGKKDDHHSHHHHHHRTLQHNVHTHWMDFEPEFQAPPRPPKLKFNKYNFADSFVLQIEKALREKTMDLDSDDDSTTLKGKEKLYSELRDALRKSNKKQRPRVGEKLMLISKPQQQASPEANEITRYKRILQIIASMFHRKNRFMKIHNHNLKLLHEKVHHCSRKSSKAWSELLTALRENSDSAVDTRTGKHIPRSQTESFCKQVEAAYQKLQKALMKYYKIRRSIQLLQRQIEDTELKHADLEMDELTRLHEVGDKLSSKQYDTEVDRVAQVTKVASVFHISSHFEEKMVFYYQAIADSQVLLNAVTEQLRENNKIRLRYERNIVLLKEEEKKLTIKAGLLDNVNLLADYERTFYENIELAQQRTDLQYTFNSGVRNIHKIQTNIKQLELGVQEHLTDYTTGSSSTNICKSNASLSFTQPCNSEDKSRRLTNSRPFFAPGASSSTAVGTKPVNKVYTFYKKKAVDILDVMDRRMDVHIQGGASRRPSKAFIPLSSVKLQNE